MINLEEEARKRRERLKSSINPSSASNSEVIEKAQVEEKYVESPKVTEKRRVEVLDVPEYTVPEGQVLLDSSGAEILSIDSKIPDTLEAQVQSLLAPQKDLSVKDEDILEPKDKNSDLKREYERRMATLNRQTKRAIVDIVRARLEQEKAAERDDTVDDEERSY